MNSNLATAQPKRALLASIAERGFGLMQGDEYAALGLQEAWRSLREDWQHLETDRYMSDGGRYRLRRYGRFFYRPATRDLRRLPHALVFQSQYINNFAGGIHRDFAPLRESTFNNPYLHALIRFDFDCF